MKMARVFGLAVVAATLAMAFVCVSPGLAAEKKTVLCQEEPNENEECEGSIYEGEITASTSTSVFSFVVLGVPTGVTCNSALTMETTQEKGQPQIEAQLNSLSFTNCEDSLGRSCTVGNALQLGYQVFLSAKLFLPGGEITVYEQGTNGQPGMTVLCQDANIFTPDINCTLKADETDPQAPGKRVFRGTVQVFPKFKIDWLSLRFKEASGSKCVGSNPEWNAEYDAFPSELWISHVVQ